MQTRKLQLQKIVGLGHEGEYRRIQEVDISEHTATLSIQRLLKHIAFLADYTKIKHQAALESLQEKGEAEQTELITMFALNEFSLYPTAKPLFISDYKKLIEEVNAIANVLPPNIYLILGTIPVLWAENIMHNIALHVGSPRNKQSKPTIHPVHKRIFHDYDYRYRDASLNNYPLYTEYTIQDNFQTIYSPAILLANTSLKHKNQYHGAIRIKTECGNTLITAIEICYESAFDKAKNDVQYLLKDLHFRKKPAPLYGVHVIVSNTIPADEKKLIAPLLHADPVRYDTNYSHGVSYAKPAFGQSLTILTYPLVAISEMNSSVFESINDHRVSATPIINPIVNIDDEPFDEQAFFKELGYSQDKSYSIEKENEGQISIDQDEYTQYINYLDDVIQSRNEKRNSDVNFQDEDSDNDFYKLISETHSDSKLEQDNSVMPSISRNQQHFFYKLSHANHLKNVQSQIQDSNPEKGMLG